MTQTLDSAFLSSLGLDNSDPDIQPNSGGGGGGGSENHHQQQQQQQGDTSHVASTTASTSQAATTTAAKQQAIPQSTDPFWNPLEWDAELYGVNVKSIDEQHQNLIRVIASLCTLGKRLLAPPRDPSSPVKNQNDAKKAGAMQQQQQQSSASSSSSLQMLTGGVVVSPMTMKGALMMDMRNFEQEKEDDEDEEEEDEDDDDDSSNSSTSSDSRSGRGGRFTGGVTAGRRKKKHHRTSSSDPKKSNNKDASSSSGGGAAVGFGEKLATSLGRKKKLSLVADGDDGEDDDEQSGAGGVKKKLAFPKEEEIQASLNSVYPRRVDVRELAKHVDRGGFRDLQSGGLVEPMLEKLVLHCSVKLIQEEHTLEAVGFSDRQSHGQEHQIFVRETFRAWHLLQGSNFEMLDLVRLIRFLKSWIKEHIPKDRRFAPLMLEKQAGLKM